MSALPPAQPSNAIAALKRERDRFVALAFSWADALLELDADGRVVYAAGAIEQLAGRPATALAGQAIGDLVVPAQQGQVRELLALARRRERISDASLSLLAGGGEAVPVACAGYHLADLNGHYFLSLRRVAAERKAAGGFGRRSRDEASGLLDTGAFIDAVTRQLADPGGSADRQCSLLVLSGYDGLRQRLTHQVEQELVAMIGGLVRATSIDGDTASRLAPDRYALLHESEVDIDGLKTQIADLTRGADPEARGLPVESASVEMAGELDGEALAQGIAHTVNRFRTDDIAGLTAGGLVTSIAELARDAVATLDELRAAIAGSSFAIAFQPVLEARGGAIHHYEAFARFAEPGLAKSPMHPIALAEETGVIVDFDIAMIEKLVAFMGRTLCTEVSGRSVIGVNVSGRSIGSLAFLARVDRIVKMYPWIRRRLLFSVTQLTRMEDLKAANNFIQRLREQGFYVGIDGFGSGAAHFSYLASLDVDMVTFAGPAIREAMLAHKGKAFLKALVDLCRELGVATIAEHIEDEAALKFVREAGVHYVQGFLFGQPAADLKAFGRAGPRHLFAAPRR